MILHNKDQQRVNQPTLLFFVLLLFTSGTSMGQTTIFKALGNFLQTSNQIASKRARSVSTSDTLVNGQARDTGSFQLIGHLMNKLLTKDGSYERIEEDETAGSSWWINADSLQGREVSATAPTDRQALIWNNAASQWEPGQPLGFAAKTMAELRALPADLMDTGFIYRTIINKQVGDFYWDPTSTAADDSVMVIKNANVTTGRLMRYFEGHVMVDWFLPTGAPDGTTDNSYGIQKAINFAIGNAKAPEVWFSGGTYVGNNIVIANKPGAEYNFVTLKIRGQSFLTGNATVLSVNNANGFGMAVMIGRQVEIENITFLGQSPAPSSLADLITWTDAQWTSGVRSNQYSPHAGIVIDPFYTGVAAGNQYPGMSTYYSNSGTGGTSQCTIRNCSFKRFVAAIIESPSGSISNGDNVKALNCYFESNKIAWAACQTQSRANTIENCYFLFHQYIVNGVAFGAQNGTPPNVNRCNIAGGTKYLYYLNTSFSSMTFDQTYMESLFSLGVSANLPIQFTDCDIRMNTDAAFSAPHLAQGGQVSFKGGTIEWFDNRFSNGLPFYVTTLSFDGVTIGGLPVNMNIAGGGGSLLNKTVFDNCNFLAGASSRDVWQANSWDGGNGFINDFFYNRLVTPGNTFNFKGSGLNISYRSVSPRVEQINIDAGIMLTIDSVNHVARFTTPNVGAYQADDVLTTGDNVSYSNDIFTSTPTTLGQVYAVTTGGGVDTVKIKYVPYGVDETTSYTVYITRIPVMVGKTFGNTTNGSNKITSAKYYSAITFLPGSIIKGAGIPAGTRVLAFSGDTIIISRNATATATGVELYDAIIKAEATGADTSVIASAGVFINKGDIMWNSREISPQNDTVDHWVCTQSGFLDNANTPRAQFVAVKTALALPVSGTYTPTVSNSSNISASTSGTAMYTRIGNIVSVSGRISVTALAAGVVSFDLSLPVPSNIAGADDAAGSITNNTAIGNTGAIVGDPVNLKVTVNYSAVNTTSNYLPYTYTYIVK